MWTILAALIAAASVGIVRIGTDRHYGHTDVRPISAGQPLPTPASLTSRPLTSRPPFRPPAKLNRAMLRAVPVLAGAVRSVAPPPGFTHGTPTTFGHGPLVTAARFWTIREPWRRVERALAQRKPAIFRGGFNGDGSGPKPTDSFTEGEWQLRIRPRGIANAEIEPYVAPINRHVTGVGFYALTVAQPKRPASETIPTTASVHLTYSQVGTPITRPTSGTWITRVPQPYRFVLHAVATGPVASKIIASLNSLTVSTQTGPLFGCGPVLNDVRAIVVAHHHKWVADTGCGGTSVTRDGHRLPALDGGPDTPPLSTPGFWTR